MKAFYFPVITLLVLGSAAAVQADPRDESLAAMQRCAQLSDRQARLDCYDQVAPQTSNSGGRNLPAAPAAPQSAMAPPRPRQSIFQQIFGNAPRDPQTTVAQFGIEGLQSNGQSASAARIKGDTVNAIAGHLAGYAFTPPGIITVTLQNGQVWRQTSGGVYAHLAKPAMDYSVRINRGTFGTYKMTIVGVADVFDVVRIR